MFVYVFFLFQYFGNVITCQWWDEIWLNEAPARFYEHKAVDAVTVGQPDEYFDLVIYSYGPVFSIFPRKVRYS